MGQGTVMSKEEQYRLALEKIANYSSEEKEHIVQAYLTVLKIAKDAISN